MWQALSLGAPRTQPDDYTLDDVPSHLASLGSSFGTEYSPTFSDLSFPIERAKQGRQRVASFGSELSSTFGSRDALPGMSVASCPMKIPAARNNGTPASSAFSPKTALGSSLEYVQFGEEYSTSSASSLSYKHSSPVAAPSWGRAEQNFPEHHSFGQFDDEMWQLEDVEQFTSDLGSLMPQTHEQQSLSASAPPALAWIDQAEPQAHPEQPFRPPHQRTKTESVVQDKPTSRRPGRQPGSKLPEEKRRKVALMRIVGACEYCKSGRRGCDPGTPCKPCLKLADTLDSILHFGPDLLLPGSHCRRPLVELLQDLLLPPELRWQSSQTYSSNQNTLRSQPILGEFVAHLRFGFGPAWRRQVRLIDTGWLHHPDHFQPLSSLRADSSVYDLPLIFKDTSNLLTSLDRHLDLLVDEHFSGFRCRSQIPIINVIFGLYDHYKVQGSFHESAALLHQALKLLILTNNASVSFDDTDARMRAILHNHAPGWRPGQKVLPSFLQAELADHIPHLAQTLLNDVLQKFLRICLTKRCDQYPVVLASIAVLNMALEQVMFIAAKDETHSWVDDASTALLGPPMPGTPHSPLAKCEEGGKNLLNIYKVCFENCHLLQLRAAEGKHFASLQKSFGPVSAKFFAMIGQAARNGAEYADAKANMALEALDNPLQLFDRHLARLLRLHTK